MHGQIFLQEIQATHHDRQRKLSVLFPNLTLLLSPSADLQIKQKVKQFRLIPLSQKGSLSQAASLRCVQSRNDLSLIYQRNSNLLKYISLFHSWHQQKVSPHPKEQEHPAIRQSILDSHQKATEKVLSQPSEDTPAVYQDPAFL